MQFSIIDADTHINEPADLWQERLPAGLRDRGPRVVALPRGGMAWMFDGGQKAVTITQTANIGGRSPLTWELVAERGYEGLPPGAWDPQARLRDMDIDMVDVHVMYPTYVLGGGNVFSRHDRQLQLTCVRAYNDWLTDFCSTAPERLYGTAMHPMTGIEDAVAEVERIAGNRSLPAVMLTSWPNGGAAPDHDVDDRFWSACEDAGVAVAVHVGLGLQGETETPDTSMWEGDFIVPG
jgi:predicted TIM-barrel fold metal-dependent hydrolase